ncbi:hypothetical protein HDU67_006802 [Dinochytrium kinnereticum]|nr:hypothetical protein HDU67_006802 [Dinochytrium kinnereticum]
MSGDPPLNAGAMTDDGGVKSMPLPGYALQAELPPLKVFEQLKMAEVPTVSGIIAPWAVRKCGYLVKTSLHTHSSHSMKQGGRSITSVLREAAGRAALHIKSPLDFGHHSSNAHGSQSSSNTSSLYLPPMSRTDSSSSSYAEEEEHAVFFVEIREHYMLFYAIAPAMNTQPTSPLIASTFNTDSMIPLPPPKDPVRPLSPTTSRIPPSMAPRETSKAISKFFKKTHEYVQNKRRPSVVDLRQLQMGKPSSSTSHSSLNPISRPSSPMLEREARQSFESARSTTHPMSVQELKRAPRTLFTYLSLREATVELRNISTPPAQAEVSRSAIFLTVPLNDPHSGGRQHILQYHTFHLDILSDGPDAFQSAETANDLFHSMARSESLFRAREADEWVMAVREAAAAAVARDEKKGPSSVKSLPESSHPNFLIAKGGDGGKAFDMGKVPSLPSQMMQSVHDAPHMNRSAGFGLSKSVPAADSPLHSETLPITPPKSPLLSKPSFIELPSTAPASPPSSFLPGKFVQGGVSADGERQSVWKSYWKVGGGGAEEGTNSVISSKPRDKRGKDWKRGHANNNNSVELTGGTSSFGIIGVPTDVPASAVHPLSQIEGLDHSVTSGNQGKTIFPLFNRPIWAQRGQNALDGARKDKDGVSSSSTTLLNRSGTINSRGSTLKRKVTATERPPSRSTQVSGSGVISPEVPVLLQKCVRLLEEIGLETEGLYRISGSAVTVDRLRKLFEADASQVQLLPPASTSSLASSQIQGSNVSKIRRGSRHSLSDAHSPVRSSCDVNGSKEPLDPSKMNTQKSQGAVKALSPKSALTRTGEGPQSGPPTCLYDNDVHVVTGVIKGFLREGLPPDKEPLCPLNLYEGFIAAAQIETWRERMIAMQDMVHLLPPKHFATMKFLCEHLQRVASCSAQNKMTQKNISIIFGPTLLRPPPALDTIQRMMTDMPFQCKVVETLLEQTEWLFGSIEYEDAEVEEDEAMSHPNSDVARDANAGIGYFDLFENEGVRRSIDVPVSEVSSQISATVEVEAPPLSPSNVSPIDSSPTVVDDIDSKQAKKDRRRGHFGGMETSFAPAGNPTSFPLWEQFKDLPHRPMSRESQRDADDDREAKSKLRRSKTLFPSASPSSPHFSKRPPSTASSTASRSQRRLSTSAVSPADTKLQLPGESTFGGMRHAGHSFDTKSGSLGFDEVFEPTKDAFRLSLNLDLTLSSFLDVDRVNTSA